MQAAFQSWLPKVRTLILENKVELIKFALFLIATNAAIATMQKPTTPFVIFLYDMVMKFGFMAVFLVPLINYIQSGIWGRDTIGGMDTIDFILSRLLRGFLFYCFAIWAIGKWGDNLYAWSCTNPRDAVGIMLAVVIVRLISGLPFDRGIARDIAEPIGRLARSFEKPTTDQDNQYTSAHEAGHILVFAALGKLPPEVEAAINDGTGYESFLGYVDMPRNEHRLQEKRFVEWRMLVALAGKMGEERLMGESTMGAGSDYARWLDSAKKYLANHNRGIFYQPAENQFEQRINDEQLAALREEHLKMLAELFDQNAQVHKELAHALLEKRKLQREDLVPFLARVTLPADFPLPFGPFEAFDERV